MTAEMVIPPSKASKAIRKFDETRRAALQPPPQLSIPDWADQYRRLSASAGAIGGKWRTSRVEIARGPMMAVKERGVQTVSVMCATQLMKTELILNTIGYHAHLDPSPILFTAAKEGAVKTFSKERLMTMIRATPVLLAILGTDRERGGDDTLQYKEFPGGFLALESAGSPTNLASRAIRITVMDEIDKYQTTKEGDPVLLGEERTSTYMHRALKIRCCSPTLEETSRIWKSYRESDQRKAYVRCPHCDYSQTLDFFRHVHWNKSEEGVHFPMTAHIRCEKCGKAWSEAQRIRMMTTKGAVRWKQSRPFECCGVKQAPMKTRRWKWDAKNQVGRALCAHCGDQAVSNQHAGFHGNRLYSPFITMAELAAKWIEQKDDPESKQVFYNTQLAIPFETQNLKKMEAGGLKGRRETFPAQVPAGVLVITAGIDVQSGSTVNEGRIEVETVGWGLGEESWSLDHRQFKGDPARPEVWAELDEYLKTGFEYEGGGKMTIRAACIDSGGHNTEEVYKFARARLARNVWAIKGAADRAGQWSPVWPIPKQEIRRTRLTGYKPVILGVNAAKEAVAQRLAIDDVGPGYAHFPLGRPDAWFDQLTSEELVVEKKFGFATRRWVLPRGRANEALDCRVYAYGALCGLYATRGLNLPRTAALIAQSRPLLGPEGEPMALPASAPVGPAKQAPRLSKFVHG